MARVAPKPWEEAYRLQGRLWRGVRLDDATRRVLDAHPELAQADWLECGCGDGKGLVPLATRVRGRVLGFDAARQGLRLAHEAASSADVRPGLVQADARRVPFRPGAFGALRAVHLLGHLLAPDRAAAASSLLEVLGPQGVGVFTEFAAADFRAGSGEEVEPGTFRRGHGVMTHYFAAGELERLLTAAGFLVERSDEERFTVRYDEVDRIRARVAVVARRPA